MEVAADTQVIMAAVTEKVPLVNRGYGNSRVGVE